MKLLSHQPPGDTQDGALALETSLGVPTAEGRWQPTRSGAVNSWAWSDETFLFSDGWLALAGPNGSGKSLTASQFITLLLDGDSSQKSLSVSGEAVGTLTDRHTNRNPREDRTGAWWLEYGRRDAGGGVDDVQYLTTGLWLRSTGSSLQRAYFIVPSRVGSGLQLHRDRQPVSIEGLARQLAQAGGQLFTDAERLHRDAGAHIAVSPEAGYRTAIRTTMFAPLDEVQFDALLSVLRSLRSVRTAEAISPTRMGEVLTEALPALDKRSLAVVAETMERIADLEEKLKQAQEETRLLERAEDLYGRYIRAVAVAEAATLTAADGRVAGTTREARAAEKQVEEAQGKLTAVDARRVTLSGEIGTTRGQLDGVEGQLRDHGGAELPQLEKRLDDARERADGDAGRATANAALAAEQDEQAAGAARDARGAQSHMRELGTELHDAGSRIGAEGALENLLATGAALATAKVTSAPDDLTLLGPNVGALAATPLAWAEDRAGTAQRITAAVRTHGLAQEAERILAEDLRRDQQQQDTLDGEALDATTARQAAQAEVLDQLTRWERDRAELPAVPAHLTDDTDDRLDPETLAGWLPSAAAATAARIDVPGRRHAADVAQIRAEQATEQVDAGEQRVEETMAAADTAATTLTQHQVDAQTTQEQADTDRAAAQAAFQHEQNAADALVTGALQNLDSGRAAAIQAALDWLDAARRWADALVHLPAAELSFPDDPAALDPTTILLQASRAYTSASGGIQRRIADADTAVSAARGALDTAGAALSESRQAAPVPAAPAWRPHRDPTAGTPLWALVDFAPGVTGGAADQLEGALLVSGLLDALVNVDGTVTSGDLTLVPGPAVPGATLADLLLVDPAATVNHQRVGAVLRAIPVDDPRTDLGRGQLHTGVVTAAAPTGYRAAFIGRSARERARLERVAALEEALHEAEQVLASALGARQQLDADLVAAAAELDALPPLAPVDDARRRVQELGQAVTEAQREATGLLADARLAQQATLAAITRTEEAAAARVAEAARRLQETESALDSARRELTTRAAALTLAQEHAALTDGQLADSEEAQRRCDHEQAGFPLDAVAALRAACQAEDETERLATLARATVAGTAARHTRSSARVREAFKAMQKAATLPDGSILPTAAEAIDAYTARISAFEKQVAAWRHSAARTSDLLKHSRERDDAARRARTAASAAERESERSGLAVQELRAQIEERRRLHGADYQRLVAERTALQATRTAQDRENEQLRDQRETASNAAAAAGATLESIAPRRQAAETHRDTCLRRLTQLITYGLATLPEDIPADENRRPAHLTAALHWCRQLLADQPASNDREKQLLDRRGRALRTLEGILRTVNTDLAKFGQQLTMVSLGDDTEWRRVTLAASNEAVGNDLRDAVATLRATTARIETDLRDDVKSTLKTSMFAQLRRDISTRRELATELAGAITTTLATVRTGVANVGVKVAWDVKKDADAQQMVALISAAPSDESFEQMYQVLRQRMAESSAAEWTDRVAHTFDYRSWHEWKIEVTHSSFGESGQEEFRAVTARSNPLKSLSTGESRLATMLPLLAAAWSMYSGQNYTGPRLISIDEIDAAFDDPNLRRVLSLLREWKFDVLATTPTITPLIKKEAQHAVVHQVVTTGATRVTIPWHWQGHGEPSPLDLSLFTLQEEN